MSCVKQRERTMVSVQSFHVSVLRSKQSRERRTPSGPSPRTKVIKCLICLVPTNDQVNALSTLKTICFGSSLTTSYASTLHSLKHFGSAYLYARHSSNSRTDWENRKELAIDRQSSFWCHRRRASHRRRITERSAASLLRRVEQSRELGRHRRLLVVQETTEHTKPDTPSDKSTSQNQTSAEPNFQ